MKVYSQQLLPREKKVSKLSPKQQVCSCLLCVMCYSVSDIALQTMNESGLNFVKQDVFFLFLLLGGNVYIPKRAIMAKLWLASIVFVALVAILCEQARAENVDLGKLSSFPKSLPKRLRLIVYSQAWWLCLTERV